MMTAVVIQGPRPQGAVPGLPLEQIRQRRAEGSPEVVAAHNERHGGRVRVCRVMMRLSACASAGLAGKTRSMSVLLAAICTNGMTFRWACGTDCRG
jgi:hypothetical protein